MRAAAALTLVCALVGGVALAAFRRPAVQRAAWPLLVAMLVELAAVLDRFGRDGFDSLRVEWQQLHAHQNMPVQLMLADGQTVTGVARGVADDGALLLETVSGVGRHHSGEVSLRAGGVAA